MSDDDDSRTAAKPKGATGLIKNRWIASLVSLILGLGLGTTLGREVLDTAGVPASCVRALQRADTAIKTGESVADDGKLALEAVKGLHIGEAGTLLGQAKDNAVLLLDQAKQFNTARKACNAERK